MNALLSPVLDRRPGGRTPVRVAPTRTAPIRTAPIRTAPSGPAPTGLALTEREPRLVGLDLCSDADLGDDARLLSAKLALSVIEVLAGARPLDQLSRWVTDTVFVQLLRRTVIAARTREATGDEARRPRVRVGEPNLHHLGDSAVEAVVMIHQPARSRAVAIRLERHRSRWRATAITVL